MPAGDACRRYLQAIQLINHSHAVRADVQCRVKMQDTVGYVVMAS